jgi:hypothetical protein
MLENIPGRKNKSIKKTFHGLICFFRVKVKSWEECVTQCCQFDRCNVAYWISSTCLHVECISDEICQPIPGDNSDINEDTLFLQVRSVRKLKFDLISTKKIKFSFKKRRNSCCY